MQRRLAPFGVPFGHWAFLRILWESDGLTQRELSREAGVMEPTTFGALKAMESRGYIARRQLAGNRRKIHIFLTRKGRALKNKLVPLAEEVNEHRRARRPGARRRRDAANAARRARKPRPGRSADRSESAAREREVPPGGASAASRGKP